jgi:hypothetical protein
MQIEHEEDGPSKQERIGDKTGPPQAQAAFAAPLPYQDPVETHSVEQCEKNQEHRTYAERRKRFEFIRNLSQECRNISPAVSRAVSHGSTP